MKNQFTSVNCPYVTGIIDGDYIRCESEIEIEWTIHHYPPATTGYKVCILCGFTDQLLVGVKQIGKCETFEGEITEHQLVDEYDDGDTQTELVSFKSWCFHPFFRDDAFELLNDLAVSQAEKRAEI